jgi:hypothetical protein
MGRINIVSNLSQDSQIPEPTKGWKNAKESASLSRNVGRFNSKEYKVIAVFERDIQLPEKCIRKAVAISTILASGGLTLLSADVVNLLLDNKKYKVYIQPQKDHSPEAIKLAEEISKAGINLY